MDRASIISAINAHLKSSGKNYYSSFYVGITNDINRRLFQEHNVDREKAWWIYCPADSAEIARSVEQHYINLGMRGGVGGGDNTSTYVYSYIITPTTVE